MKKVQLGSRDLLVNGGGCPVEVFCRLRPPKDNNNDQQQQQQPDNSSSCIKIASSTELVLYSSENAKNGQIRESRYEFSHILTDNISQLAAFKELALPLLNDLIQGKSSVLFTYGITGSGKTYTMMGPLNNPGLIPRSFDVIFNSIGSYLGKKYLLRSDRQNSYEIQSEADILFERQRREIQMKTRAKIPEASSIRTLDTTSIHIPQSNANCSYFVFVTFVEIYNNYIYDLFDDDILNKAPQSKQLREDNRARPYIKDVKEIEIRSSEEAIDLLNMGLKRRRIAHTQLNTESSRSHSVLSMRLVQFQNDIPPTSLTKDDLTVSTIHLVDLAGSERVNRAKTVGERVKEASNINSSLMVLRQCFETLRENQAQGTSKIVPYRESKLTSFFKSYFDGEGQIRMILCVNPTVDGYEEIQHALKFGELTKDVMVPRALPPPPPLPSVPPKITRTGGLREIDNQQQQQQINTQPVLFTEFNAQALIAPFPSLEYSLMDGAEDDESILILQEHLRRRIEERQRLNMLIQDQQEYLRKFTLELASDYDSTISNHEDLSKENDQQTKTIRHLQTRIKLLEKSQNDLYKTTNQTERENKILKAQIEERNNEIKSLKFDRRKDKNDFENKMKIKLNEVEQQYINEIKNKEIKMRELGRQHDDKLNIIRSMAASNTLTNEQFVVPINSTPTQNSTEHAYQNQQQQYHRVEMIISQNCNTPILDANSRQHAHTPNTEPMPIENGNGHPVVGHPRQQHRRSRSLSEVWLEHRPQGTVQTETLLQPKFHKKVCTQQAPAKQEIVRTTKYVLTHQNLDAQGELVTDLVKGDVLPSSTGGVNVIFNDVERLTCTSPPDPLMLHKRCQSEERVLHENNTQSPSTRQGPAVAPKRFRM
ncbi:unnamed protein product [Adineta steineri]|uniref:Kinesin-like protein n=1 Tax=Adineta steineri TaxID=433720 RepID=A0A814BPY7_9BILA|nr:unnamed protein product [Adineta steineri]CAF1444768.1 unnamed protein product [Adineta steineri]